MLTNTLLERVWSRDLHHRPQPHSIAMDAALVVLERSSKVSRIDPASDGPMLFAATQHGDYLRLDTRSALRWEPLFHHPAGICTHRPRRVGDLILFQDGRGDLCGYGLTDGRLHWRRSLAHNRADVLPAAALGEDCIAVGTSFGQVLTLAPDGTELGHQSVAKRVGTDMIATDNGVIFGTQGAIVGYRRVS